jgi:hypothetical protein
MSTIINNISGTKDRRYSIAYGISLAGSTARSVVTPFIDVPDEYRPETDIAVFISSGSWASLANTTDDYQFRYSVRYDDAIYNAPSTLNASDRTNLQVFSVDETAGNPNCQIIFGNPVFPILNDASRATLFSPDAPTVMKQTNTWLVLRKSVNGQAAGDSWSSSQLSGFALSADSIPLINDGDVAQQQPAIEKQNVSNLTTTVPSITNARKGNFQTPDEVAATKSYLAIAVAASTNPALTGIDWGFPGGETYSSGGVNGLYTVVKVLNMSVEEYLDGSQDAIRVNDNTPMIGIISIFIGELRN